MKLRITVQGVAYDVEVEVLDAGDGFPQPTSALPPRPATAAPPADTAPAAAPVPSAPVPAAPAAPAGQGAVACPVAGTVVELKCMVGQQVKTGDTLVVIEAMKMNTNIAAPTDATIRAVRVAAGDAVHEGQVLVELG